MERCFRWKKVNLNHFRTFQLWLVFLHVKGFSLSTTILGLTSVSKKIPRKKFQDMKQRGEKVFGGKKICHIHLLKLISLCFSLAQPNRLINVQLCVQSSVEQQPAEPCLDYRHVYKPYSSHTSTFTLIVTLKIKRQPQHSSDN